MAKVTITWGDTMYEVDQHLTIALMPPDENVNVVTAVFFDEHKVPTHVANWPKRTVQGLIEGLTEMLNDFA